LSLVFSHISGFWSHNQATYWRDWEKLTRRLATFLSSFGEVVTEFRGESAIFAEVSKLRVVWFCSPAEVVHIPLKMKLR
jgi:hypothetical protein